MMASVQSRLGFVFTVIPIRTKDFMWSLGTSFSGNSNNVKSEVEKNGT
ncbi:MAG: hypothetical protein ACLU4J_10010 [Butyricimonas paravirosa]